MNAWGNCWGNCWGGSWGDDFVPATSRREVVRLSSALAQVVVMASPIA